MNEKLRNILNRSTVMVIDGSMSTALEQRGADLNNALWTARVLAEQPDLVCDVHKAYFRAGADCGITASYQATIPGLVRAGYTPDEAESILARSVQLFCQARQEWWNEEGEADGRPWPLCLAAVGPYGAYLADGSEYRGNYRITDDELREFHRRRMEILWHAGGDRSASTPAADAQSHVGGAAGPASGADLLLIETIPSLREAVLCAELAEELGADYWISFSCRDGKHISEGDEIAECARALAPKAAADKNASAGAPCPDGTAPFPHLQMLGINCTDPRHITSLIAELRKGTDLPIGVYPNSGDKYDPSTKTWKRAGAGKAFGAFALSYMEAGAAAVGGCCTTVESHIRQVTEARRRFLRK